MRAASLADLCEINVGRTPARAEPSFWGDGHKWLSIADMNQGLAITQTKERITEAGARAGKIVKPGTVLLSFKLSIGKVGIAEVPMYTNEAIAALPIKDSRVLDPRYLMRALEAMDLSGVSNRAAMGATLNKKSLAQIRIGLPPLPEQRRIARILDHADALRAKRRQVLAHLDSLTQAIFSDEFTGKVWPTAPLAHVVRPGTLVTYGIVQAGPEFDGGVPYIRTGDIMEGHIATSGLRHTDPEIAARFQRSTVRTGDIVMSIRATVGTTALVPAELEGANLTQGTARIAPSEQAIGPYLLECLRSSSTQQWIQGQIKGATFREITLSRLRELAVPLPPRELQDAFAKQKSLLDAQVAVGQRALQSYVELFASLQSRAFRGEL